VQLCEVVATSAAVTATSSRSAKVAALAELLRRLDADEVAVVVAALTGEVRQGRIGVGWATVRGLDVAPAAVASLTVADVDRALDDLAALVGPGSQAVRATRLDALLRAATAAEQTFLGRLLLGELRQGALAGVVADSVAKAAGVPLAQVRRAAMLAGDLPTVATIALADGATGLAEVGLQVGRFVQPMLAAPGDTVAAALPACAPASVEQKLDGARLQAHRSGHDVRLFTRNGNDVTARLAAVADLVRALPCTSVVLDGEVIGLGDDDRPQVFQDTMSRFGRRTPASDARSSVPVADPEVGPPSPLDEAVSPDPAAPGLSAPGGAARALTVRFFDCLHRNGVDLLDEPLSTRAQALAEVAAGWLVPSIRTDDPAVAEAFLAASLAAGHEGVVVKDLASPYEAGRRGGSWRKVKPVRTLDLIVLAVEWGSGRRRGWLSNLHLGARDPDGGPPIMVGKTFKGMTDELLRWQTAALLEREVGRDGHVVIVRPELVVEIALDGAQRSTRYPGGVALRFARVRRYRPDKTPAEADLIDAVRALL
jgi:DNA ligase-1